MYWRQWHWLIHQLCSLERTTCSRCGFQKGLRDREASPWPTASFPCSPSASGTDAQPVGPQQTWGAGRLFQALFLELPLEDGSGPGSVGSWSQAIFRRHSCVPCHWALVIMLLGGNTPLLPKLCLLLWVPQEPQAFLIWPLSWALWDEDGGSGRSASLGAAVVSASLWCSGLGVWLPWVPCV